MRPILVNKEDYCQYLLATVGNYTGSHLAEQLDCSHDAVTDALHRDPRPPRRLWDRVSRHWPPKQREGGVLGLDDSVLDKRYACRIELARRQWSGNAKKVIAASRRLPGGIGLVNLLYGLPPPATPQQKPAEPREETETPVYLPVDYRLFDPDTDGLTKHDHARQMLHVALFCRGFAPPG